MDRMTIDLTPTPAGLAQSVRMFEVEITKSEAKIAEAEECLESFDVGRRDWELVTTALEALIELEGQRIGHMRAGIAAATAKPVTPEEEMEDSGSYARALCREAGVDPDKIVCSFTLEDLAYGLEAEDEPEALTIKVLQTINIEALSEHLIMTGLEEMQGNARDLVESNHCTTCGDRLGGRADSYCATCGQG